MVADFDNFISNPAYFLVLVLFEQIYSKMASITNSVKRVAMINLNFI